MEMSKFARGREAPIASAPGLATASARSTMLWLLAVLGCCSASAALSPSDWQAFLARSDPIFSYTQSRGAAAAPTKWYDAAFTGNGPSCVPVCAARTLNPRYPAV